MNVKLFLQKHWKDLLQLAGFLGAVALLERTAGVLGLILAFGVGLVLCVVVPSMGKKWTKWIAIAIFTLMIYPTYVTIDSWSKSVDWKLSETEPLSTEKPKVKKKADDTKADKKEELIVMNKLAVDVNQIQGDIDAMKRCVESKMDADFKEDQERSEKRHTQLLAKLDVLREDPREMDGGAVPPKTFESVPQKPKAEEIPSSEPKLQPPDLWVQADRKSQEPDANAEAEEWPTHVLGSCGRAHAIIDWVDKDGNGKPEPVYGPCRDIKGNIACSFVRFGVMKWK